MFSSFSFLQNINLSSSNSHALHGYQPPVLN